VRQVDVDELHGLTMTVGLKTLLRMDPDIIFVGEIRDVEAASIAMRAASSGKHVFSTLHTRDVAATITAVRDLQIDNRSLAANLTGIINQRLLRTLCRQCIKAVAISDEQREVFARGGVDPPGEVHLAEGCDACRGTGVHGRIGVFEAALVTDQIEDGIADGLPEDDLRDLIRSAGALSLSSDALVKVRDGLTSFEEATRMRWL
jgi:type II secretory ATPase GspE/PulE/Tfp pilus assembly ATPase PilB-like protein